MKYLLSFILLLLVVSCDCHKCTGRSYNVKCYSYSGSEILDTSTKGGVFTAENYTNFTNINGKRVKIIGGTACIFTEK